MAESTGGTTSVHSALTQKKITSKLFQGLGEGSFDRGGSKR